MKIDPLLEHYPIRIREVTLGVMLLISFIFYAFPRFLGEAQKFEKTIQEEIETFDIPQTEQIKLPEPPPRPSVPVASEDEFFDEDITIEDTDLETQDDNEVIEETPIVIQDFLDPSILDVKVVTESEMEKYEEKSEVSDNLINCFGI